MTTSSADTLLLCENALLRASFSRNPITPLQVDVELVDPTTPLSALTKPVFLDVFCSVQHLANQLKQELGIHRFGLISEGKSLISLIPMHGIEEGAEWKPILAKDSFFFGKTYPGYICSRNGKKMSESELEEVRDALRAVSGLHEEDIGKSLIGEHDRQNLFARLILEEIPCWKFHDTASHVAFLTPFPNTTGYSCVIPKRHYSSDILAMPEEPYRQLLATGWDVAQEMKKAFNVDHVGVMMEGYEINHAHLKVVPIFERHRTEGNPSTAWFERYEGYLSSQKGKPLKEGEEMEKLEELAGSLRGKLSGL
jgi:beta-aspartyl-peptidase (threonine type)